MRRIVVAALACTLMGSWGIALAGDAAAGKAKAAACAGCHGPDGNSMVPTYPKIAGQHEAYLADAMTQYKTGARNNATMKAMMTALSDADIANLAAYYSSQNAK